MEYVSKALIIAGGFLLSILFMTLMMFIFRTMADNASNFYPEINESDITSFNQKFFNFKEKTDRGKELVMQDIITIANLAKDNNQKGKMPVKVSVKLTTSNSSFNWCGIDSSTDLASLSDENLRKLLANNFDTNVIKFSRCDVNYGSNSKLVNSVEIFD